MILKALLKGVYLLVFLLFCGLHVEGQSRIIPEEARAQLAEKGLTEEEVRIRLRQKGWDVDNLDPTRLPEFQQVLMQTVDELEREKLAARPAPRVRDTVPVIVPPPVAEKKDTIPLPKDSVPAEVKKQPLQIYGHHLFKDRDLRVFRQIDEITPPDSYVLGTGDVLLVQIYGSSQHQASYIIDELGYIQVPRDGPRIALKGLTLGEARRVVRERLRRFFTYSDDQFSLGLQKSRNVTVNFFGEVSTTGGITLSAANTLFNALAAAGGPTMIGSVRNIRLISGSSEKQFDLYRVMSDPRLAEDFYLQNNDYVHIPVAERVVTIQGAVQRPFKYELAKGEHLIKLIEFAGGTKADAYLRDVQITRYTNDERIVASVNLREILDAKGDYILYHGDEIMISSLAESIAQYVEIRGAVVKAGLFEFREGMRVADVLDRSTLLPEANRDFAYLLRYNPNGTYAYMRLSPGEILRNRGSGENLLLSSRDIIEIPSLRNYTEETYIATGGSVRIPGRFRLNPTDAMRLQDALMMSGGLQPSAADFGYIVRRRIDDPKRTDYLPFNPVLAHSDANSPDNLPLEPMDSIYVFDKRSLEDEFNIRVSGAVRRPGFYAFSPGLTVNDALRIAGGFTFGAATNRVDVSRVIIRENEPTRINSFTTQIDRELDAPGSMALMPFDHIIVREVPEFQLERTVYIAGEVKFPGIYSIVGDNERMSSFINRAGGLTQEAFPEGAKLYRSLDSIGVVVVNLQEGLQRPNSSANLILRSNDTLFIPKRYELITIAGAVNFRDVLNDEFIKSGNKITVGYVDNKNAMYYIDQYAAGIAENGKRRLISVRHANGRLEKTKSYGFFLSYPKVTPGATINVGAMAPKGQREPQQEKQPVDWGNVIRDTIAQATAVLTLILLLERVN